jgi:hypothetical protein
MSGLPDIVCASCGSDLTAAAEVWDNASPLCPLLSVEVLPCSNCLTRAACEGLEAIDRLYTEGCQKIADIEMSRPEGE